MQRASAASPRGGGVGEFGQRRRRRRQCGAVTVPNPALGPTSVMSFIYNAPGYRDNEPRSAPTSQWSRQSGASGAAARTPSVPVRGFTGLIPSVMRPQPLPCRGARRHIMTHRGTPERQPRMPGTPGHGPFYQVTGGVGSRLRQPMPAVHRTACFGYVARSQAQDPVHTRLCRPGCMTPAVTSPLVV